MLIKFDKLIKEKREINLATLKDDLKNVENDNKLRKKIENYADRYGFPLNYVYDKLKYSDDDMILSIFEKDPSKQNIHEKIQFIFVKQIENTGLIIEAEQLKKGGKNALYIKDGEVKKIEEDSERKGMKSLDFKWKYCFQGKELSFYTSCKYTKETGGAQDNQGNDVITTLELAKTINDNDVFIIAIVDGEYYEKVNPVWNNRNFYDDTNSNYPDCRYMASNCDNLFETIKNEIIRWLNSLEDVDQTIINNEINRINGLTFEYQEITIDQL